MQAHARMQSRFGPRRVRRDHLISLLRRARGETRVSVFSSGAVGVNVRRTVGRRLLISTSGEQISRIRAARTDAPLMSCKEKTSVLAPRAKRVPVLAAREEGEERRRPFANYSHATYGDVRRRAANSEMRARLLNEALRLVARSLSANFEAFLYGYVIFQR